jgi:hypothetical protein
VRRASPGEDCSGVPLQGIADSDLRDRLQALSATPGVVCRLLFAGFASCPVSAKTHTVETGDLPGVVVIVVHREAMTRATTGIGKRAVVRTCMWRLSAAGRRPGGAREILRQFGHVLGFQPRVAAGSQRAGSCPPSMPAEPIVGTRLLRRSCTIRLP